MSSKINVTSIFAATVAFAAWYAVPVAAAQDPPPAIPRAQAEAGVRKPPAFPGELVSATSIIKKPVRSSAREDLGRIEDFVLDPQHEQIDYAVLTFGGVLGMGEKLFAVPMRALKLGDDARYYVLDYSKETLKRAPGFDKNEWPEMGDAAWRGDIDRFYAGKSDTPAAPIVGLAQPALTPARSDADREVFKTRRLSDLIGMPVVDKSQAAVGELQDVTFDAATGRVAYANVRLVEKDRKGRDVYVPWHALNISAVERKARINLASSAIVVDAFEAGKGPNLNDRAAAAKIFQQFEERPYWETPAYLGDRPVTVEEAKPPVPSVENRAAVRQNAKLNRKAWGADSEYTKRYKAESEKTVEGRVISVGVFQPDVDAVYGRQILIEDGDGKTVIVHGAPIEDARMMKAAMKAGDKVKVVGSEVEISRKRVIIAREIEVGEGKEKVELRDKRGVLLGE